MARARQAHDPRDDFDGDDEAYVKYFKERVYATFTGLAIVLVVSVGAHADAAHGLIALLLGVLGIVAAGFVSDVIAHLAVHRSLPTAAEFVMLLRIAAGGFGTVVAPAIVLVLAQFDVIDDEVALRTAIIIYIVTLAVIGWLTVRRSQLAWWGQLVVLAILVAFGLLVIGVQALAHGLPIE